LSQISTAQINDEQWTTIVPNSYGDWLSHRSEDFSTWPAIGTKKKDTEIIAIFNQYCRGLATGRDAWVYNYDQQALKNNVEVLLDTYNQARQQLQQWLGSRDVKRNDKITDEFLKQHAEFMNLEKISWNRSLKQT